MEGFMGACRYNGDAQLIGQELDGVQGGISTRMSRIGVRRSK
jgi:hypothetical protein